MTVTGMVLIIACLTMSSLKSTMLSICANVANTVDTGFPQWMTFAHAYIRLG